MSDVLYQKAKAVAKKQGFQLPPEVSTTKIISQNGYQAYRFAHFQLGEIGQLEIVPHNGQTKLNTIIPTSGSDYDIRQRKELFLPIAEQMSNLMNMTLGVTEPSEKIEVTPSLESGIIQSEMFPCESCGKPTMVAIYAPDADDEASLLNYYDAMKEKINDLKVPTWIVGKEHDIELDGLPAGNALCLTAYPKLEKAVHINSVDFGFLIDKHTKDHCDGDVALSNDDISSKYLLWREAMGTVLGELLNLNQIPNSRFKEAAKILKIYKHGEIDIYSDCEKDTFDYFTFFHYRKESALPWISLCLRKAKTQISRQNKTYKQIVEAIKDAYFTCLEVVNIQSLEHGIMTVFDLVKQEEYTYVDRALCQNVDRQMATHVIGTVINSGHFMMNVGGGIPLDSQKESNLAVLNEFRQQLTKLNSSKELSNKNHYKLACEITKLTYKLKVMRGHSVNYL
ncbi:hypothetical protein L3V86_09380 [Thiotrichales bacterium 19S11-10]|nr:hypothetical protein [Thiotrichales bacterium 19S11-10]